MKQLQIKALDAALALKGPYGILFFGKTSYLTTPLKKVSQMTAAMQNLESLLSEMTRGEKAQALQWFASDLGDSFPGIESDPKICGGSACITRTRIPVWLLEQARRQGISESDILRCYPTLHAADLSNAWAYVRSKRSEINREIQENEES